MGTWRKITYILKETLLQCILKVLFVSNILRTVSQEKIWTLKFLQSLIKNDIIKVMKLMQVFLMGLADHAEI